MRNHQDEKVEPGMSTDHKPVNQICWAFVIAISTGLTIQNNLDCLKKLKGRMTPFLRVAAVAGQEVVIKVGVNLKVMILELTSDVKGLLLREPNHDARSGLETHQVTVQTRRSISLT